jgi:hypothetical protein
MAAPKEEGRLSARSHGGREADGDGMAVTPLGWNGSHSKRIMRTKSIKKYASRVFVRLLVPGGGRIFHSICC